MTHPISGNHEVTALDFYNGGNNGLGMGAAAEQDNARSPLATIHQLLSGRYLWAILLAVVLAGVLAPLGYYSTKPMWQSLGVIQVRSFVPTLLFQGTEKSGQMTMYDSFMDTQVTFLTSQRVIDAAMSSDLWKQLGRGTTQQEIQTFAKSLIVTRKGEFINVIFYDPAPDASMKGTRSVIEAYFELYGNSDMFSSDSERMRSLEQLREKYAGEIRGIQDRINGVAGELGVDVLEEQYRFKMKQLNDAERDWRAAVHRVTLAQGLKPAATQAATSKLATIQDLIRNGDPVARGYFNELQRLEGEMAYLRKNKGFGDNHPSVKAKQEEIDAMQIQIDQRITLAGTLSTDEIAPTASLQDLKDIEAKELKRYEQARIEATDLGRRDQQIKQLQMDLDDKRSLLDATRKKIEQLNVESMASNRVRVLSTGDRPTVAADKRVAYAAGGGFAGFVLGFGVFLIIGFFDKRFRSFEDAQYNVRHVTRMLGVLPSLPNDLSDPEHAAIAAHCVHQIRTLLQVSPDIPARQAFVVTSPSAGDGKTSLCLAMGLSYAAAGSRTLLIDCDVIGAGLTTRVDAIIRRKIGVILEKEGIITHEQLEYALQRTRNTGQKLGEVLIELKYVTPEELTVALKLQQEISVGLLDAINGEPLETCLTETGIPGLSILPLGSTRAQHVARLSPTAMARIVEQARKQFDTILIDTGPILGSLEASIAASQVDGVVLAVSRGEQRGLAERAMDHLASIGARVAGLVFNRASTSDFMNYGYGYTTSVRATAPGTGVSQETTDASERLGPVASAVAAYSGSNEKTPPESRSGKKS